MKPDALRKWVATLRRERVHQTRGATPVDRSRETVTRVLPHRDPFLLVDRIVAFNAQAQTLLAEFDVRPDDPVFRGHFPGRPLFPAALQIEAIGQAGLCLWAFAENNGEGTDLGLRVARVEHAAFVHPVVPGDTMALETRLIHADDLAVEVAGQVWVGDTLCSMLVIVVVIVDE